MRTRTALAIHKSPITKSLLLFSFPLFFILLADSVMSYIFPVLVERLSGSNAFLGLIMALSSLLGIFCDFTFPQLIKNRSWKFQLTAGIILAILFPLFSNLGAIFSIIFFFVIATLIWGVYFEFLQFCQQSFIVDTDHAGNFAKDWGVLYFVYEITINAGPIIGSILLRQMFIVEHMTVSAFQVISLLLTLIVIFMLPNKTTQPQSYLKQTINLFKELRYWERLGERVWPIIISGVMISFVNASFWTIGGLFGLTLAKNSGYDWLVMILYGVPLMIGSFLLSIFPIKEHKKFLSQLSLFFGGLLLFCIMIFSNNSTTVLLLIAGASFALSFAGPLNEAVYSDLLARSSKSRIHLLGIAKANTSLAYILAPLFSGFVADVTNYYVALSLVGALAAGAGLLLLWISPKKLKLPQQAITHFS